MNEDLARLVARRLLGEALNLSPEIIPDQAKIYELVGWDSFGHLMIIQHVERELNVVVDDETTFEYLTSLEAIVNFVRSHAGQER